MGVTPWSWSRAARLAWVIVLIPLGVAAVALFVDIGSDYLPTADFAYTEMLTRDVGNHDVLVGLYSRGDWNHPGPTIFYLLALPYRLVGGASIGIHLGALLINGAAIVGMALIARRRGGTPLMLFMLLGILVLVRALGADFLRNPWNPYVTVLPFGLLVLLSWSMACRETWALPVAAGVATFLAQTHVGYVALAVPLVLWGAAWLVPLARRGHPQRRDLGVAAVIAVAVAGILWLPPLIDELAGSPGNLTNIIRYFRDPSDVTHSLLDGYRVVMGEFGLPPEWIAGPRPLYGFNGEHQFAYSAPAPLLLIPFGVAAVFLWRTGSSDARRLVTTLIVALAIGVVAVMRTIGQLSAYRLRWTWMLAMLAGVVVLWAAWTWLRARSDAQFARGFVAAVGLAIGALVVVTSVSAARAGIPLPHDSAVMATLVPSTLEALPPGDGEVLVRYTSNETRYFAPGIVLGLEREGVKARVEPDPAQRYGSHRIHRGAPVRAVLTMFSGADAIERQPGRRVAFWSDHPKPVLERAYRKLARLRARLDRGEIGVEPVVRAVLETPDADAIFMETPLAPSR